MLVAREAQSGYLPSQAIMDAVHAYFAQRGRLGRRILLIVPDNTRSGPVGEVFQNIFAAIGRQVEALDVLVALGTHPPLTEAQICRRLAIPPREREATYAAVRFFNHEWGDADALAPVGVIPAQDIHELSDGLFAEDVSVAVNKLVFQYDEVFIIGPVFPHEVVGFSGGSKYIFPGIAGAEIINFLHWLGAVITNLRINGTKWTPTRRVVERAAALVDVPRALFALVNVGRQLKGLYIGEVPAAWEKAADRSAQVHVIFKEKPFHMVVGIAPRMYDDLWTAGKVMYKLEPIVADGGTLIIYAPHIREISYSHGHILDAIGYHTRDYFLKRMDRFAKVPRGVLAHATHVKGIGTYSAGVERPRIQVVLATGISSERCRKVNLGYMNPDDLDIGSYENREHEGVLVVPHAGELLYRLANSGVTGASDRRDAAVSEEENRRAGG